MRGRFGLAAAAVLSLLLAGCGGKVDEFGQSPPPDDDGGVHDAGPVVSGEGGSDGSAVLDSGKPVKHHPDAGPDAQLDGGAGPVDAFSEYHDPGCPDASKAMDMFACDPNAVGACGPGEGCYPFVHPSPDPCTKESYGASCMPSGAGAQGDDCSLGCQPNHVCVISGQGTQCVALCDLSAPASCTNGLICSAIDVPGIGGCI